MHTSGTQLLSVHENFPKYRRKSSGYADASNPSLSARIKSLYFEENTEIQAFLLPTENSFNCIFAVACEEKTGKIHTFSHEIHTTIGGINVIERSQLPLRELILFKNIY